MAEIEFIVRQTTDLVTNQTVREIVAGGWMIDEDRKFTVLYRPKAPAVTDPDPDPSADVTPAPAEPLRLAIVGAPSPDAPAESTGDQEIPQGIDTGT